MRKTLTLAIAATALLASGAAIAQTAAPTPERAGQRGADMTREAAQERATTMFERLDINSDGTLSAEDRAAAQQARFDRIDADGNGSIDPAEFAAIREQRGERRAERRAERGANAGAREGMRGQRGDRMAGGQGRMGRRGQGHERMIARADSDNDGTVTQAEFLNTALTRFDSADANSDGTLTREERRAARPEGRRGGRRGHRGQQAS